mgnify:CR=1 FL=1
MEGLASNLELDRLYIHGDPKVANIMIDEFTGKGTSIVDLDTVKPGLIHYDFGDAELAPEPAAQARRGRRDAGELVAARPARRVR